MKAKIILYGWVFSFIPMMAGIGTMEWAIETGDHTFLLGLALFMIFVIFCCLVIKNREIVDEEVTQFDLFFCKTLEKLGKWLGIG